MKEKERWDNLNGNRKIESQRDENEQRREGHEEQLTLPGFHYETSTGQVSQRSLSHLLTLEELAADQVVGGGIGPGDQDVVFRVRVVFRQQTKVSREIRFDLSVRNV